jgi:phenylalanyl-tRNA synthetase beta chain
MANIKVPKSELKKVVKNEEELIEKIDLMGTPVEGVDENDIEIQILPNRSDCLSVQGFLRAFKAYAGKEIGLKKYKVNQGDKDYRVIIDKSVGEVRPYTACAIVKGLKFDDERIKEIIDMQEKLHTTLGRGRKKAAIGIYPLEKIKLPIRFEARKPEDIKFQPLEMPQEMNGLQILQRHPTGREYAHLLEGKGKFPVFVDASGKILSMPPIINSHDTGKVGEKTDSVFVECSGFDFNVLNKILNIIVTSLAEMGGKIYSMELDYGKKEITPNLEAEKMKISLDNVNKLIGLDLKEKDLEKLLPKMGYDYSKGKVAIPAWRADVLHEVDIIEDIAIAYGYDKLVPEIPKVATIGEESEESKVSAKIEEILVGLGLIETSSFHLIRPEEAVKGKTSDDDKIELENSKSEYKLLRNNLLIPGMRILSENKDNEYPQKIFEIGKVFIRDKRGETDTGIKEFNHLFIASTPGNFTEIKQILDYLFKMLNMKYELKEGHNNNLIEGRTGIICANGSSVGIIGEVHPGTLRDWNIKLPVSVIEINLDLLMKS